MSVAEYARLAHDAIDELVESNGTAVVAGGTGLYLRAALVDLRVPPAPAAGSPRALGGRVRRRPGGAHARLADLDPPAAVAVHPNDRRRVVRALELAEAGASLAPGRRPALVGGASPPDARGRSRRAARACSSADPRRGRRRMFAAGVVEEVRAARTQGVSRTAEKAMGLRELAELPSDEAFERIVVRTRRYAAYQRKWMRRIPGIVMIEADRPADEVADAILEVARAR